MSPEKVGDFELSYLWPRYSIGPIDGFLQRQKVSRATLYIYHKLLNNAPLLNVSPESSPLPATQMAEQCI